MPLTASEVAAFKATDKRQKKSCGDSLFLMVEPISQGGGKSFFGITHFPPGSPKNGGKRVEVRIGPYGKGVGKWTFKEARNEWDRIRAWSKENKRDPRELKKEEKAVPVQESLGLTREVVCESYESYQKELALNPQSSTALLNLGALLLQQGNAAAAIKPLVKIAATNPSEQCSLLLAQAYQSTGKSKEAISEYEKIGLGKTQDKIIPFNLGLCLLDTGNNIDAIKAFNRAINIDESFLPAWGNIGTALMNEGRYHEAFPVTQKVVDLDPNNPTAHMNLGIIYKELGNLDQALSSTLKSTELKPDNPTAHMNLGIIYKELGDLDQALASTLKSLEISPNNPDANMSLGEIYFEVADYKKSEEAFDIAISLNRQINKTAVSGKAACRLFKKDYNKSLELIESLPSEERPWLCTSVPKESEIKSIIYAKLKAKSFQKNIDSVAALTKTRDDQLLVKVAHRPVEEGLVAEPMGSALVSYRIPRMQGLVQDSALISSCSRILCPKFGNLKLI